MLVKFLARGTGSAQAAADYLLRETDSQGAVREDVAVLRGDPDDVAAVADSLEFDHKYTSGVIAWAPEDQPSDQDIDRVLDEFEQTAWAGLAPDRHAWAAVQHRAANGGVHVHVLAARCDLETGKSLNIAPPGWEQTYGPLVEACNLEHGWSRPDDPARARGSAAGAPCLSRGGGAAGGDRAGGRSPGPDRGPPAAARRVRDGAGPGRRRRGPTRVGTRRAARGQALRDRPRPEEWEAVAVERRAVRA